MTRIVLIQAGPTPWDLEDRLVGNHPLPLTDLSRATIESLAAAMAPPPGAVYRARRNEACDQAARIIAGRFALRPHDSTGLEELNLGLWQGLTRSDLRFRFPSVFPQWEESPLAVNPPEGEPLPEAVDRLAGALRKVLRRHGGGTVALPLRPLAMQIVLGLLRHEDDTAIAAHLHKAAPVETIELADDDLDSFL